MTEELTLNIMPSYNISVILTCQIQSQ